MVEEINYLLESNEITKRYNIVIGDYDKQYLHKILDFLAEELNLSKLGIDRYKISEQKITQREDDRIVTYELIDKNLLTNLLVITIKYAPTFKLIKP